MIRAWVVMVGDAVGNTGSETLVGPFRSEARAYEVRDRIERHLRKLDIEPLADVVGLTSWREAILGLLP